MKIQEVLEDYGNGIRIMRVEGVSTPIYYVPESDLSQKETEFKEKLKSVVKNRMLQDIENIELLSKKRARVDNELRKLLDKHPNLPDEKKKAIRQKVIQETIGYGPIDPLLGDGNLEEIMVSGSRLPVFVVHRVHGTCMTNVKFKSNKELMDLVQNIATLLGKEINFKNPLLDARLSENMRINFVIPPVSLDGPSMTIRQFSTAPMTIVDLMRLETINPELAAFLWICVDGMCIKPANILIVGGSASGKTTTLNSIMVFVPEDERIVTVEDTEELRPIHQNRARMETFSMGVAEGGGISMEMLIKNALRMRPDRIVVGEMRGQEAKSLFVAMNSGHDGCMGTIHANSVDDAVTRLTNPPMDVPKPLLVGLDLIILQRRVFGGEHGIMRKITEVSEVIKRGKEIVLNRIFDWDVERNRIEFNKKDSMIYSRFAGTLGSMGININDMLEKREGILEGLLEKDAGPDEILSAVKRHTAELETLLKSGGS